jgi:hypothetical protein
MGFAKKAFVAAGVGFAAAALVGCGSSGRLLSTSEASTLTSELNHVSVALEDGECGTAEQWLSEFENQLQSLSGVNSTLVNNLNQGATTTQQLTERECRPTDTTPAPPKPTRPHTTPVTTPTKTFTQTYPTVSTPTVSTESVPTTTPTYSTSTYSNTTPDTTTAPSVTTITAPPPNSGGQGLPPAQTTTNSGDTNYGDTTTDGSDTTSTVDTTTSSGYSSTITTATTDTTGAGGPGF